MNVLLTIGNWLLPLLYLALMIDYGVTFFLRVRTRGGGGGIVAVVVAHAAFFALRTARLGYPPLTNVYEILSFVAVSIAAVTWLVERVSRDRRAGAFVFLVAFALQYTSSVFLAHGIERGATPTPAPNIWDQAHAISAVLAYTALILAGVYAILRLVTERSLKRHQFGPLFDRLPPMELLGKMMWASLLTGLVFLTVAVVSGPFLFQGVGGGSPPQVWHAKTLVKIVLGTVAWVLCLAGVGGKVLWRWPIRRVSAVAVAVFAVILVMLVAIAVLA